MPKRTDIHKILIIGSGPIVIGQACEFDYSGTQGCKALREEGYEVVLVNSNPATVMTDPGFGDRTYIEPLTVDFVKQVIEKERPDALLPTLGGQTALNLAMDLQRDGVLERLGVEMIGANAEAIERAEDREAFKNTMAAIGADTPQSGIARSMDEADRLAEEIGYPLIIRPAYTLGGSGGGIAYNKTEFHEIVERGLRLSPVGELLIEESIIGWKEFELEVMRDRADNFVVICTIENVDAMGVHTGDSITVAPAQTLTDVEYQAMRDEGRRIIRAIGVETGGSNIQFAIDPKTGRRIVIEMNPRVSRSSALASKATGFPIAKIAAKLAVGYTLDEIRNDITRETPACFEPAIDYCVVKIPRFTFEKFPGAIPSLGTAMKSVGETMAIGRNFREALQKALRGLETGRMGLGSDGCSTYRPESLLRHIKTPTPERIFYLLDALREGHTIDEVYEASGVDPWFLAQIEVLIAAERDIASNSGLHQAVSAAFAGDSKVGTETPEEVRTFLFESKQHGFSDRQIAFLSLRAMKGDAWADENLHAWERGVRRLRHALRIHPVYKSVDTCAAEFEAYTPYFYSTYEERNEATPTDRKKVLILGGGPNRIGQGIEFDYCCVQAAFALRDDGFETIMVNSNPETVSTDYDTSDRLYFEPLTAEDVLEICRLEKPDGVIVQLGGQTPLKLAHELEAAGVPILGTSPANIDLAEDREQFGALLKRLGLRQPENGFGRSFEEVKQAANSIGYPVVVRPSYVLGGRAMEIVFNEDQLRDYMKRAVEASPEHPVLIDRFLVQAVEVDVDAISDGEQVVIAGIMEHIEAAGIHSGDSCCVLPTRSLTDSILEEIRDATRRLGEALNVRGLLNIQFAVKDHQLFVLEVNPRASRTVPFVSKATGVPFASLAARVMGGKKLSELGCTREPEPDHYSVKEAVLPFHRFPGSDVSLGPEMRSTGEVMGIDSRFAIAFAKAQISAGLFLPESGGVFFSIADVDKPAFLEVARSFHRLGFDLLATPGTRRYLAKHDIPAQIVEKISIGRPHALDYMINGEIQLVVNTRSGPLTADDERAIRIEALRRDLPLITTIASARACTEGIEAMRGHKAGVKALQDYH
ncbi:carbamoyl-phosphate synthase large subunit [bacterium]|nr:carbamoyl-phosphate synthase large subunit [bacterium]